MALALSTLGSLTALTIADSACIEADGTYDLIFTGSCTTAATGTYTIASNVITAVSLTSGGSGYSAAPTVATQTADGAITATFVSFAASQDLQSRHPLVEITSSQRVADIPFDGSFLTGETFNEFGANPISHSSGRLCIAYCYGPDADGDCGIKYVYTDTDRLQFTTVTIELYTTTNYVMKGVSICEMSDGNIGLTYLVDDTANHVYRLLRRIITVTGTAVSNAEIANWSHDTFTSDPWVSTIGTNSYLLVYGKANGSDYYIYKRTSSDFATWSAESALSIGGLTSTMRLSNPSILKITTGDIWLWFDVLKSTSASGDELTNVYYSTSADGSTWADAVKWSDYDTYSEIGKHPVAVQKIANQMHVLFTRQVGALHMDGKATGWSSNGTYNDESRCLSFDSVNRKLYIVNMTQNYGTRSVIKVDVDTWAVDKYWDTTTAPGFPAFVDDAFSAASAPIINDGHHIVIVYGAKSPSRFVWHLDGESDTITNYYFDTNAGLGITQNVTHSLGGGYIKSAIVKSDDNKIWLLYNPGSTAITVGYLDLTETSNYEFHEVVNDSDFFFVYFGGDVYFDIDVPGNRIVVGSSINLGGYNGWPGDFGCYDLTTGAEIFHLRDDAGFPKFGVENVFVHGDYAYTSIDTYTSGYGQDSFRGLVEINLTTGACTYHRPSYCTDDNHHFYAFVDIGNAKIAMVHQGYGIAIFDTISKIWELYNNDNIAGLTLDGSDDWGYYNNYAFIGGITYDATNEMIMVGDPGNGVVMFFVNGDIRQAYYSVGTYSGGAWTFSEAAQLVQGFQDYDAGACVEQNSTSSMYVFWTNENTDAEKAIKWDKDGSTIDISPYIVGEVEQGLAIDGNPHTLSFSVSHGHLFDQHNTQSLLSTVLKKGRKLALKWGESINGNDYWQECGHYYVTGTSFGLKRGEYPVMKVDAEDQRTLWQHGHVYVTPAYNNTPEYILADLATDVAGIAAGNQNIPTMTGSTAIQMQWIESTLDEIFTQLCERFGYYYRFDYQGKLSVKKITNAGSIDHTYTDNTKLIEYSPDDKYSDFTNRVTVRGQEMDWTTVTYEEERISQVSGTLGWWGCDARHVVWFSDDKSRRCVNPGMRVIETSTSIPFKLAGSVSEYLEECGAGDDNKFCTVYVDAPNLIPILAVGLSAWIAGHYIPDIVISYGGGTTIPIGRIVESIGCLTCMMVLGSVANYQLEVWAQPLGSIRRSCQASWNDTEHQTEIGSPVEQVIDDPLCYSVADCSAVANFEGMVCQMQRNRVKFKKIAHVQDEDGDTIRVVHPYSGDNLDLFVAKLTRTYTKNEGFFDEIEGWVCS